MAGVDDGVFLHILPSFSDASPDACTWNSTEEAVQSVLFDYRGCRESRAGASVSLETMGQFTGDNAHMINKATQRTDMHLVIPLSAHATLTGGTISEKSQEVAERCTDSESGALCEQGKEVSTPATMIADGNTDAERSQPVAYGLPRAERDKLLRDWALLSGRDKAVLIRDLEKKGQPVFEPDGSVKLFWHTLSTQALREMQVTATEMLGQPAPSASTEAARPSTPAVTLALSAHQQAVREGVKCCVACKARAHKTFCTKCRIAGYCSKECQSADWKVHRQYCKRLAEPDMCATLVQRVERVLMVVCFEPDWVPSNAVCYDPGAFLHIAMTLLPPGEAFDSDRQQICRKVLTLEEVRSQVQVRFKA